MCLAVPVQIESISGDGSGRVATVEAAGVSRRVVLSLVPDAGVGDWVLVHSGIAFQMIEADAAQEVLDLADEVAGHM